MAQEIACSTGCKRTALLPENGNPPDGWEQLQITSRWRCPHCYRELTAANYIPGTPSEFKPDTLPPGSIGALKKLPEAPPLREEVKP